MRRNGELEVAGELEQAGLGRLLLANLESPDHDLDAHRHGVSLLLAAMSALNQIQKSRGAALRPCHRVCNGEQARRTDTAVG